MKIKVEQFETKDGRYMAEEWPWGGWAIFEKEGMDAWRFWVRTTDKASAVEFLENNTNSELW